MSASKRFARLGTTLLTLLALCSCGSAGSSAALNASGYTIFPAADPASEKWGNYLHTHLSRRCEQDNIILFEKEHERFKKVTVEVNAELTGDYSLEYTENQIHLKAKNNEAMLWLIYQFIEGLGAQDNRFAVGDLPPAVIDFRKAASGTFDFIYREPYFAPNLDPEYASIIGTQVVERYWGIWGHNLGKVLEPDEGNLIYAKRGGAVDKDQFCFSNPEILKQLKAYIFATFGNGEKHSVRFMIMPNDNKIACDCRLCKAAGNTPGNATPAVSLLIRRLAAAYPHHVFFTTAYHTTQEPPTDRWPANTGIMVSTINLPKGVVLDDQKEVIEFLGTLRKWNNVTQNMYIWDYASNFDDYLTPVPVLYGLKTHLKFYKNHGINGVFLNASGSDYSPFQDMKAYVAAALMMDCNASVDSLCTRYFRHFYPTAGETLSDYYLGLEKGMQERQRAYDMYGSFNQALKNYLDQDAFVAFYNTLPTLVNAAKGDERKKLHELYTALSFPRLQLAYSKGSGTYGFGTLEGKRVYLKPEIQAIFDQLAQHTEFKDLVSYKEFGGDLEPYLKNWQRMFNEMPFSNRLIGTPIKVVSTPDEGFESAAMLCDGVPGFAGDYHQGWYLSGSSNLQIDFDASEIRGAQSVAMRFLQSDRHGMHVPQRIVIYKNGEQYKEITQFEMGNPAVASTWAKVDFSDAQTISIRIFRNQNYDRNTIACDEIWIN